MIGRASLLFALLLLAGCQAAFFGTVNLRQPAGDVVGHRDITYNTTYALALDVYAPPHTEHAPVVVYFYGGSWMSGKRQWFRWMGEALAAQGVVAIVIDVRLG